MNEKEDLEFANEDDNNDATKEPATGDNHDEEEKVSLVATNASANYQRCSSEKIEVHIDCVC